jgi:hypothetical protein
MNIDFVQANGWLYTIRHDVPIWWEGWTDDGATAIPSIVSISESVR